jgi:predicted DNA-binding antitoxin AbrB/MazE fold protein
MAKQLEVIYEGGVLRPLQPLPFAERQRLIVTISGDAAAALNYNPRTQEFEWLRVSGPKYAGKYVAIEGDRLVGVGDSVSSVLKQARDKGSPHPLVHHVPKGPSLPFAGW